MHCHLRPPDALPLPTRKPCKVKVLFLVVCRPKFMKFRDSVKDYPRFPTLFTIVYIVFLSEDIRN